jgi:hypothetical protein
VPICHEPPSRLTYSRVKLFKEGLGRNFEPMLAEYA